MRFSPVLACGLATLSAAALAARPDEPAPKRVAPKYETKRDHDPDGIGKFYMGREIARVMGYQGASWLERPERVKEEEPAKLIEALAVRPGMVVADVGAGSGYHTFLLAPLVGDRGKVIASDIQPEMLEMMTEKAKKLGVKNVETVRGTETDPKLPADGVDLILMVDVYHEFRLEDPKVFIKLVHKMSERQVLREMEPFAEMEHTRTIGTLPWQHVVVFTKRQPKN